MAGDQVPEVGDKAHWNWNGSKPSGEVAEKKDEGEINIQSKRGNTITKEAKPDDPAVHLARPGNDVVKNQSDLHVDEKNASGASNDTEKKDEGKEEEKKKGETNGTNGTKRKAEDESQEVAEGEKSAKKAKPAPKKDEPKAKDTPKAADKPAGKDQEKKPRGRPKGHGVGGTKKEKKPPAEGTRKSARVAKK